MAASARSESGFAIASRPVPLMLAVASIAIWTYDFFPAFARLQGGEDIVARLKMEHLEDDCAAADLSEVLLAHGHGRPIENPEALGYMLRALFESMRRHIAFERDHVLPGILRQR